MNTTLFRRQYFSQYRFLKCCCILHIDAPPSGDIYLGIEGIYGLTRERIRQIESKALKRLRHPRRLNYLYGFYKLKENLQYSSETGEFSKLLTSKLMVDDIFTRIGLLKSSEKITLEQNDFS
jgi:hypothetical protein